MKKKYLALAGRIREELAWQRTKRELERFLLFLEARGNVLNYFTELGTP
ncbi:hypothetical protein MTAT_25260 [Moorella thermoacetica]|uniref:Uncharacterized protein n=1 Tax=Neomoorella thermoacetica TaxID=1525 RepID=A0AAC9MTM4_NEOTH|nr:hypothetical protein Maut_00355 [Moorella thermoacetica]TYL10030.1 hypothetical protein MTAT_25260 [Moorella thermoacetica]